MAYMPFVFIYTSLLLVCSTPASLDAEENQAFIQLAAVGSQDGPPPCGPDGVCNLAVCSNDPDCPKDLPENTNEPQTTPEPSRPSDIKDCQSRETTEIGLAIDWGADNWSEYEKFLEGIMNWSVTIGNCLENRFKKNGKVVCEASMKGSCTTKGNPNNGWASPLNKKCHLCSDFLADVRAISGKSNRQACYFSLITHEWGHTCERGHKTLEIIDDKAFEFWKSKHSDVTIDYKDCGLN